MRVVTYTDCFEPDSSVIDAVFYNEKTSELFVKLTNGGAICGYGTVSRILYEDFAKSDSAGAYWNAHIKNNKWLIGISGDVDLVPAYETYDEPEPKPEPEIEFTGRQFVIHYTVTESVTVTAKTLTQAILDADVPGRITKVEIIFD